MNDPNSQSAFAPPSAPSDLPEPPSDAQDGNGVRTAGILLLVESAVAVISWAAQWYATEGGLPTGTALGATILRAMAGIGLLWLGRRVVVLALTLALVAALGPVVHVLPVFVRYPSAALLLPSVVRTSLAMLPPLLLLVGRPGRTRQRVAIGLFVFAHVLGIVGLAIKWYVTTRVDTPAL